MQTKICKRCLTDKPLTEYHTDRSRKDGLAYYCKGCLKEGNPNKVQPPSHRVCKKCGIDKPIRKFNKQRNCKDGYDTTCRYCRAPHRRKDSDHYKKVKEYTKQRNKRVRIRIKTDLIAYLGGQCAHCGLKPSDEWPVACFDFHHMNPAKKEFNFNTMLANSTMMDEMIKEADGCLVYCANCHRRHHALAAA